MIETGSVLRFLPGTGILVSYPGKLFGSAVSDQHVHSKASFHIILWSKLLKSLIQSEHRLLISHLVAWILIHLHIHHKFILFGCCQALLKSTIPNHVIWTCELLTALADPAFFFIRTGGISGGHIWRPLLVTPFTKFLRAFLIRPSERHMWSHIKGIIICQERRRSCSNWWLCHLQAAPYVAWKKYDHAETVRPYGSATATSPST